MAQLAIDSKMGSQFTGNNFTFSFHTESYQPLPHPNFVQPNVNHFASYTPGSATSDGANLPGPVLAGDNTAAHVPIFPASNQFLNNAAMLSQNLPVYTASGNASNALQPLMPPPPLSSRKRKAPTLRDGDWTPVKARILELHIEQNTPLPTVKILIEEEFSFEAT